MCDSSLKYIYKGPKKEVGLIVVYFVRREDLDSIMFIMMVLRTTQVMNNQEMIIDGPVA